MQSNLWAAIILLLLPLLLQGWCHCAQGVEQKPLRRSGGGFQPAGTTTALACPEDAPLYTLVACVTVLLPGKVLRCNTVYCFAGNPLLYCL